MKLYVSTQYLDPISIGPYEWVEVYLSKAHKYGNANDYEVKQEETEDYEVPDLAVCVFDDAIYVKTGDDIAKHKDGKKIWTRPKS